jgi:hypothetical protein
MNAAANVPVTTGSDQDATILAMKRRTAADIGAGNTDHVGNYDAATVANKKLARARMLARCAPGIPLYDDTGDAELKIDMVECYLSCVFVMPVHGTVQNDIGIVQQLDLTLIDTETHFEHGKTLAFGLEHRVVTSGESFSYAAITALSGSDFTDDMRVVVTMETIGGSQALQSAA